MRRLAAPTALIYGLTQTFMAFDMLMALDAHWYSTIFGVYFFAGSVVATFSLLALMALWLRGQGKLVQEITLEHYHDLGKLMFGFTVFTLAAVMVSPVRVGLWKFVHCRFILVLTSLQEVGMTAEA